MKTILTRSPLDASAIIKSGGLVAFPTETVYGLGASAFDAAAIAKIFAAKQRPADNPLIVHIAEISQIEELTSNIPEIALKFIEEFFPGPLTVILPRSKRVPQIAAAGLDSIGVRMPALALAREFLSFCGTPVAAPSANLSGRPSPTSWQDVVEDLDGRIDCILQGDVTEIGLESTVVDCTTASPVLLRPGAISLEQLKAVVPETCTGDPAEKTGKSPGTLHKHYAPRARVILDAAEIENEEIESTAFIGLHEPTKRFGFVKVCGSVEDYARSIFGFFRECDRRGFAAIFCEAVHEDGIGRALMDRLRRAAERR